MTRRASIALALGLLLLTACSTSGLTQDESSPIPSSPPAGLKVDPEALDAALQQAAEEYNLPGAVAGVWVPDAPEWTGTVGDVTVDDHFPIRSVTKSFTVTLLLQLVDEGLVRLDDPISDYVEGIPGGDKITLAMLAGMTSGLADYSKNKEFLQKLTDDFARQWTPQQLIGYGIDEKPLFAPGTGYGYSNTNTVLLGEVIEKVGKASLEEQYRTRIWEPLGLTGTSYPDTMAVPDPSPQSFLIDEGGASEPAPAINPTSLGASGGIISTLEDLHLWGEALGSGSLVGPALQLDREEAAQPATSGPEYDNYGLGIGQIGDWWGHTGEGVGFNAAVFRQAGSGAVIVVLVNSSQGENAATKIFLALSDEVGTPI